MEDIEKLNDEEFEAICNNIKVLKKIMANPGAEAILSPEQFKKAKALLEQAG